MRSITLRGDLVLRADSNRGSPFPVVSYLPNALSSVFVVYHFIDAVCLLVVGILRLPRELAYLWGQKLSAVSSKR
jgi:hypothetical protein